MIGSVGCNLFLGFLDIGLVNQIESQDLDFFEIIVEVPESLKLFLPAIEAGPQFSRGLTRWCQDASEFSRTLR